MSSRIALLSVDRLPVCLESYEVKWMKSPVLATVE